MNGAGGLNFVHKENTYDDFAVQVLMPQKRSEEGPLMSTADVNGDGKQDLFIGGGRGQGGTLFLANSDGRFHRAAQQPWSMHKDREDQGSIFFDADGDGDQDLLVLSGSNEVDMAVDQFHPASVPAMMATAASPTIWPHCRRSRLVRCVPRRVIRTATAIWTSSSVVGWCQGNIRAHRAATFAGERWQRPVQRPHAGACFPSYFRRHVHGCAFPGRGCGQGPGPRDRG
ncbi:MAG: VCBS repeat-containing protein [Flavobacteriales bacterium]|nr:VCBS repeat-containing protein [Flavobacteriales bacterium]